MPTADLAHLRALRDRLGAAMGGDREIDGLIWGALVGRVVDYPLSGPWKEHPREPVPELTASIDAALALVERVLPDKLLRLSNEYMGFWKATVGLAQSPGRPTAPLAILSALLSAQIAELEASDA